MVEGVEEGYLILEGEARVETEVLGSRFIATLAPANTEDEARALIDRVRSEMPDASHHCFAYRVGAPGSTQTIGCSDDGEPHGSAGRPMLDVVLHSGIGDLVVVVTRYFGGRKLGRGGLVRAYGGAVQAAVEVAATRTKIDWVHLTLELDYARAEVVARRLPELGAEIVASEFGASARHRIRVPRHRRPHLERMLDDITRGEAVLIEE